MTETGLGTVVRWRERWGSSFPMSSPRRDQIEGNHGRGLFARGMSALEDQTQP